jgi:hypothetical protein
VAAIVAVIAAAIGLAAPAVAAPVAVVAALVLAWLGANYLLMRGNLLRYRAEIAAGDRHDGP